ncbi:MAG: phosphoribosylformylglycinamidine synthase II, partial [Candidatus Aenigmatarchaeota archaeon]
DKMMRVKENGKVVCEVPVEALTKNAPLYERETEEPAYLKEAQRLDRESVKEPDDFNKVLLQLLDSPTISSKESEYRKFTTLDKDVVMVGAGSDAAVIKVKGTNKALAISVDCNGRFCYLNPYNGAMMSVAEAARNIVCAGGRPLAITDGLNFGNPMKPENYWQFQKCIEGLSEACKVLNTPVISGNVSFYNENPKGSVDPSPMVGMVGLIENADKHVTQNFKNENDLIVLLGENKPDLSGSEYLYLTHKQKKGNPRIDIEMEKAVQEACLEAIESGIINSAHDCSEGGLAVTLAESCITNQNRMFGAKIKLDELKSDKIRLDEILFGESPSRIVISLNKDNLSALEQIAEKHSVPYHVMGEVGGENLVIQYKGKNIIGLSLEKLNDVWRDAIPSRVGK